MAKLSNTESEIYALVTLYYSFPDVVLCPVKSESPDWIDEANGIGIEVTRAETKRIGYANNFADLYLGKEKRAIPKKHLDRMSNGLFFSDGKLRGVSDTNGLVDGSRHIIFALDATERKLTLLNSGNYRYLDKNCLFLYLSGYAEKDDVELFSIRYLDMCNKFTRKFENIFLMNFDSIFRVSTSQETIRCHSFEENTSKEIIKITKEIAAITQWKDGKHFFDYFK